MITAAILACALALPASPYQPILAEDDQRVEEVRRLRDFIEKTHPGAEIKIQDRTPGPGEIHDNRGWERLPFRWRDKDIWIKRPEVHDRKRFYGSDA